MITHPSSHTLSGSSAGTAGSGGGGNQATNAFFNAPWDVATDMSGNFYVLDKGNYKIRIIDSAGIISLFAGTGTQGSSGDGGAAASAKLTDPIGIALDSSGNVYVADGPSHVVRVISSSSGIINTFAGGGTAGVPGDGGAAASGYLDQPYGVAFDASNNLYIADHSDNRIRMVAPAYNYPTNQPTSQPSKQPTQQPTSHPTRHPTRQPTSTPSQPSGQPSRQPTRQPTMQPSRQPSVQPSRQPTSKPSQPSGQPSRRPSRQPTAQPVSVPSGTLLCRTSILMHSCIIMSSNCTPTII